MLDAGTLTLAKRTIEVRGFELPFTIPAIEGEFFARPARSGVVFVPFSALEELDETDSWDSYMLADTEIEQALIDAGWARKATRGGIYSTEEWRDNKVLNALYDLLD